MICEKKMVVEIMYKTSDCLICHYMEEAIREVMPDYGDYAEYRRVDILKGDGKKRFLALSVSLFGEEEVYKKLRIAPIPSMFINGELIFDVIPPRPMLEEAFEEVIAEHNMRG